MGRELMILTHDDDDVCMYTSIRGWAGSQESTALLSNKACFVRRRGGSHMMKQSAGLVLTTLNGFVIVGLEIVVVL